MPSVSRGHPAARCDLNGMMLLGNPVQLVVSNVAASTPQVSMRHITLKPMAKKANANFSIGLRPSACNGQLLELELELG